MPRTCSFQLHNVCGTPFIIWTEMPSWLSFIQEVILTGLQSCKHCLKHVLLKQWKENSAHFINLDRAAFPAFPSFS